MAVAETADGPLMQQFTVRRLLPLAAVLCVALGAPPALAAKGARTPNSLRGEFVSACAVSHRAADDPIVFPNMTGASHPHDFFGNPTTDAASTVDTLIGQQVRCSRAGDSAAYWVPTLYQDGKAIEAKVARAYYRQSIDDAAAIRPFPLGLKMLAGNPRATTAQDMMIAAWACTIDGDEVEVPDVPTCAPGRPLRLRIIFPDCWNGVDLDSTDHRSHMAYASGGKCPPSHPVAVPKLVLSVRYSTPGGPGVTLASGGSYSGHADFFNAWDPSALQSLVTSCLNAQKRCGDADAAAVPKLAPRSLPQLQPMIPPSTAATSMGALALRSPEGSTSPSTLWCQLPLTSRRPSVASLPTARSITL